MTQFVSSATLSKSSTSSNFWLSFDGSGAKAGAYEVNFQVEGKYIEVKVNGKVAFRVQGS